MTKEKPPAIAPPEPVSGYWTLTRSPFTCLTFMAPLLVLYEIGIQRFGGAHPELLRNGADHWMRGWLNQVGLVYPHLLPVIVIALLLGWQIVGRFPWQVSMPTVVGMYAESLLFAFGLIVLGQLQDQVFQHCDVLIPLSATPQEEPLPWMQVVSFIGAGIYEEVLFRLCLLPVCYALLRLLLLPSRAAAIGCIVATSVMFAAAHYIGPGADEFSNFNFSFRVVAGLVFAALFTIRGFGIAVGCHSAYDVLVGVLLQPKA